MHSTEIVTSFITRDGKFLLLKRSQQVRSMKGLWAAVSGIIEKGEQPLDRAKIEIYEEVGIGSSDICLVKSSKATRASSPQYKNHEWIIWPFLFSTSCTRIRLNWENSDYTWVEKSQISDYDTVPNLSRVLAGLL